MPGPNPIHPLPTQEFLQKLFDYNAETGVLTWRCLPREMFKTDGWWHRAQEMLGKPAGYPTKAGRFVINLNGITFCRSRLVWKWAYGFDPHIIDHINGDPGDDRLCNLRDSLQYQNLANQKQKANSTAPYKGITLRERSGKPAWGARITHQGKDYWLGSYPTPEEAAAAYAGASIVLNENFARTSYDTILAETL